MKRTIVDGWDTTKAMEEATALGLTNETLKLAFSYLQPVADGKERMVDQTGIEPVTS